MSLTPEIDKMRAVIGENDTQTVGEFIEWLGGHGYSICTWDDFREEYEQAHKSPTEWLAEMHDIDLAKVEEEREAILTRQRLLNLADDLKDPLP